MDAVNLGRVGLFLRGEWLPDTSYVPLDVVSHDGASYAARLPSTNVEPSVATYEYWQVMAGNSVPVDDTLSIAGEAADAKAAGDRIGALDESKADKDGYYPDLTAGNADQLLSTVGPTDKMPYLLRPSGGGVTVSDLEADKIVGGTVVWNQLVGASTESVTVPSGHILTARIGGTWSVETSDGTALAVTSGDMVFDLTRLFGAEIAGHVLALEELLSGAGSGWFRKLFPGDYAYNSGEMMHVKASAHVMVGLNAWDEEWETGRFDVTTGADIDGQNIRAKNLTPIVGGTAYHFKATYSAWMLFYDAAGNILENPNVPGSMYLDGNAATLYPNTDFTPPMNARYMRFFINGDYGTVYNHDICINVSGTRNGEYQPHEKHAYPLTGSLEMRGIPKLDANGGLYYDGDTYESDGKVTRRYALQDLGALTWAYTSPESWLPYGMFYANLPGKRVGGSNIRCRRYITMQDFATDGICFGNVGTDAIYIIDSAYSGDAAAFKVAIDGEMLLYELASPSEETAAPYKNPQWVEAGGTEGYTDTRPVGVPVGHDTHYLTKVTGNDILDMKKKIDGNGTSWPDMRVLVIGDSISTDVYGGYKKWVTDLIEEGFLDGDKTTNDSIVGTGFVALADNDSGTAFLPRLQTHTAANFDAVILFGGINDFLSDVSFSTFQTAVAAFMDYLANNWYSNRIAVILPLATYNNGQNSAGHTQQEYSEYIRQAAKTYCLPVLNLMDESGFYPYVTAFKDHWTFMGPWGETPYHDGVHPTQDWEKNFLAPMIKKFLSGLN